MEIWKGIKEQLRQSLGTSVNQTLPSEKRIT